LDGVFSGEDESEHLPEANHGVEKAKLEGRDEEVDSLRHVGNLREK